MGGLALLELARDRGRCRSSPVPRTQSDLVRQLAATLRVIGRHDGVVAREPVGFAIPILYGFESYASFPIFLKDGTLFGTLCAIDPEPRALTAHDTIALLESFAKRVATILSSKVPVVRVGP